MIVKHKEWIVRTMHIFHLQSYELNKMLMRLGDRLIDGIPTFFWSVYMNRITGSSPIVEMGKGAK